MGRCHKGVLSIAAEDKGALSVNLARWFLCCGISLLVAYVLSSPGLLV